MLPTTEARAHFFNESEGLRPFTSPNWRGCALDRDEYNNTRIPEHLFNAIVTAAAPSELSVCGYFPAGESCTLVAPTWQAYSSYLLAHGNWSLEYVVFDSSQRWALLADADVTIFGAAPALAATVDSYLAAHRTSLVELTDNAFPGLDPAQSVARYLLAVTGR